MARPRRGVCLPSRSAVRKRFLAAIRHCPRCKAEYAIERADCSDCGGPLLDGPSPRFDPGAVDDPATATTDVGAPDEPADDEPLQLEDFVALVTLRTGEAADALGDRLAEAGIATVVTGSAGIRMHAPDHAPMGPLTAGTVDVGVFPEDLERATDLLDDWPGRDAIIEEEDDEPPPAASTAPQSTSPVAIVLIITALGALIAAWVFSTVR